MESRSIGREGRMNFGHVAEKRNGILGSGDCSVRLKEGIIESKVERGFCGGDEGGVELLGISETG